METPGTAPRRDRIVTAIAWCVLLALTAFVALWQVHHADGVSASAVQAELEARFELGMRIRRIGTVAQDKDALRADRGPPEVRQRAAVLAGELSGAEAAHRRLRAITSAASAKGGATAQVHRVLLRLYPDAAESGETQAERVAGLGGSDRELLLHELGWFGRLALAPEGGDVDARNAVIAGANRTASAVLGLVGFVCFGAIAGLTFWAIALVQLLRRRLDLRHTVLAGQRTFGAETYASWSVAFIGLSLLARFAPAGNAMWASVLAADFLAMAALAVPVVRGVPWTDVRRRLGLHRGAGLLSEIAAGFAGFAAAVPAVVIGAFVSIQLRPLADGDSSSGEGGHPLVQLLSSAQPGQLALLFFLLSVSAPLVEETMFRGVLFGHLREATSRWPRVASVLVSAAVSSLLFAADHPQGWTAIPALGSLAAVLCLVREWRGSLIAPMVMHGLWNGAIGLFAAVALSS